jgi:DNA-binding IclR family transcriptional regulator
MTQTIRPVPAVKRAVDILHHLSRIDEPQGVSQIARAVDIIPSSCLHILRELTAGRLVRFDAERKVYRLGLGILDLARGVESSDLFVELAQPHLSRIAREHHAIASASVFDGKSHIVVVATSGGNEDVPIHLPVGLRVHYLSSATGRVLAAFQPMAESELRKGFDSLNWQRPTTYRRWKQEIVDVRVAGYAIDEGAYRRGITVVAAPVFDGGERVEKFLGASMLSEQVSGKALRELAEEIRLAGLQLSKELRGAD